MLKYIRNFFKKLFCIHKYDVGLKIKYEVGLDGKTESFHSLVCEKCGKVIKIYTYKT